MVSGGEGSAMVRVGLRDCACATGAATAARTAVAPACFSRSRRVCMETSRRIESRRGNSTAKPEAPDSMRLLIPLSWRSHPDRLRCRQRCVTGGDTGMGSLMRRKKLGAVPTHLGRALASVKAGAARLRGTPRSLSRSGLPQMVAPELEWDLLRAVEQAARHYRRAQQELAHRE